MSDDITRTTRKIIRQAIVDALFGNIAAVGQHVYASRVRPLPEESLPAILVYTTGETATVFNAAPRELERVLSVAIHVVARADDALDDLLDSIAEEVEFLMSENQEAGDASDIVYTGCEINMPQDGDNQHGFLILNYDVTYYTLDVSEGEEAPGVPQRNVLKPFQTAGATWQVPPFSDKQPETKDEINLPQ